MGRMGSHARQSLWLLLIWRTENFPRAKKSGSIEKPRKTLMDNSVASVSREFRVACLGRGPKMPDPPVLRILGSKLAVQGRYNERLFLRLAAEITVRRHWESRDVLSST